MSVFPYQSEHNIFKGNSTDAYNLAFVTWQSILSTGNRATWQANKMVVDDWYGDYTFYDYVMRLFGITNSNVTRYSTFSLLTLTTWNYVDRASIFWQVI